MESTARSSVEDSAPVSEFLGDAAAWCIAVIELDLKCLDFFLRILELAVSSGHLVEGWAP